MTMSHQLESFSLCWFCWNVNESEVKRTNHYPFSDKIVNNNIHTTSLVQEPQSMCTRNIRQNEAQQQKGANSSRAKWTPCILTEKFHTKPKICLLQAKLLCVIKITNIKHVSVLSMPKSIIVIVIAHIHQHYIHLKCMHQPVRNNSTHTIRL